MEEYVKRFDERCPFKLAQSRGIHIIEESLGEVYGYYNRIKRIQMIHINNSLTESIRRFTCAHELGHAILHPHEQTPKLSRITMVSNLKVEREANEFATHLLIDGSHEEYHINTTYGVLDYYGIPHEMERFLN